MIFPWGYQGLLNGVAEWLSEVPAAERPKVAFNIVRPEYDWYADAERRTVAGDFGYARRWRLRALIPPERLVITAVDPRLCRTLAMVCEAPVHEIGPHVTYPSAAEFEAWRRRRCRAGSRSA